MTLIPFDLQFLFSNGLQKYKNFLFTTSFFKKSLKKKVKSKVFLSLQPQKTQVLWSLTI